MLRLEGDQNSITACDIVQAIMEDRAVRGREAMHPAQLDMAAVVVPRCAFYAAPLVQHSGLDTPIARYKYA